MTPATDSPSDLPALAVLRQGLVDAARSDSRRSERPRTWVAAAAVGALCVLVATTAVAVLFGDDGPAPGGKAAANQLVTPASGPGLVFDGDDHLTFEQLVDRSELVVAATVLEVRPADEIVDIDPEYPTRVVHAVLEVDDVLKGPRARSEATVATIETAYAPVPGAPPHSSLEWRRRGEQIVAFLTPAPPGFGELYVPTSYSQSFYRLVGNRVLPLTGGDARGMRAGDFEAAVRAAAE